jgi:hypothetical protein
MAIGQWATSLAHLHFSTSRRKMKRISGSARLGSKGVARKNHEARFTFWDGRASRSFPQNKFIAL